MAAKSVRLYVDKNYRYHYLSILGHDPPANQSLETISGKMRDWDMDCDVDSGGEGEQSKAPDEPPQEMEEGTAIIIIIIMSGRGHPLPPSFESIYICMYMYNVITCTFNPLIHRVVH